MTERRKRLIEVAFPLEEVSAHSRREKNIHHGHISTLHIWWARRPLAACRAFIYASLVNDPETDAEREALLDEIADLASWDAVRHPEKPPAKATPNARYGGTGLTGTELLERARERILRDNGDKPPKLLDPFAGGGAIPLEGLRLGCEVEASDLNPVAVLILKGTLEYPQQYAQQDSRPVPDYIRAAEVTGPQSGLVEGDLSAEYRRNPLAADVRYWGNQVLECARKELAEFYPPESDGRVPVAYLWSRTIPCPSCSAEMPLNRQFWLARKPKKKVALEPIIDHEARRVDFRVVEGRDVMGSPEQATTSRGDARCLLCGQVVKSAEVRQAGIEGKLGATLTAVALADPKARGKSYRQAVDTDWQPYQAASNRIQALAANRTSPLSLVPDEPIDPKTLGLRVDAFGIDQWSKLFNDRQLLTLATLLDLVRSAHSEMINLGMDSEYTQAVSTYLSLALSRYVDFACTLSKWKPDAEAVVGALAMQTLPMVWDYAEQAPLMGAGGSFLAMVDRVASGLDAAVVSKIPATVTWMDARIERGNMFDVVLTDPPYYNSIDYAGLSDFFYVWLKRASLFGSQSELMQLPLAPKRQQAIMASEKNDSDERARYVSMMSTAFRSMERAVEFGGLSNVVFAHASSNAWATLIEGLLQADLVPSVSWPIDTEAQAKVSRVGQARLSTSVWMACRKRNGEAGDAFLGDVLEEMQPVIRERLLSFWRQGIRGADFFISAIGPALSVFGRHRRVLNPDGSEVSVRDFLDIVRRESTAVALEQVLQGADLDMVDSLTRHYVTWIWSYSRAALDAGEALALCLATGTLLDDVTRDHSISITAKQRSKKVVKLRTIVERAREDDDLGGESSGRNAPLIDQLQCAAWLWGQNQSDRLSKYRAALGESCWSALLTLGQAVASCLPEGDEDRRIILGLLGATVRATEAPAPSPQLSLGMDEGNGTK